MVRSSIKSVSSTNQPMDKLKFKANSNKFTTKNFETLFGQQIGLNERLIADYSGAILRDIIISGRLYITPSHLCFYGSLLKWETKIAILLTDISSIVKARTIKVIPNAIQIVTRTGDKYVFTSLTSRHKVYLTLVSAWTANLSNNLINYGSEAGGNASQDSSIRKCYSTLESGSKRIIDNQVNGRSKMKRKFFSTGDLTDIKFNHNCGSDLLRDNEHPKATATDKPIRDPTKCPYSESCLADVVLPINLNRLFEMLFTDSSFNSVFSKSLRHTITVKRDWSPPDGGDAPQSSDSVVAVRQLSREMVLDYPFAKNMSSEEMMHLEHLDASNYYGIKLIAESSGIPLCSLFHVVSCYCLHRTANPSETHFHFHYKVVFKSKAWGFKAFIEEGTKRACLDYIESLIQMIKKWSVDNPEYAKNNDFPTQLVPYCTSVSKNEMPLDKTNAIQPTTQPTTVRPITRPSTPQRIKMKMNESEPFPVDCPSPASSQNKKNLVSHSLCDDRHILNIVKYLRPFIALLSLLTIVNLFLMVRLMNHQILSHPSCPSNQVSSSLIGLSTSEETFESLSSYAYPNLGCHG